MSDTPVRHRVQLAYDYAGHSADEIIEVDADEASRLLHEGKARLPDDEEHRAVATSATETQGVVGERGEALIEAPAAATKSSRSKSS
jgi:hypothetical protein